MSGRSFTKIYIHAVWHIKFDSVEIKPEHRSHLYANMGAALKELGCEPIIINGTGNHVHALFVLSKNYAVCDVIARVKRTTSCWIKQQEQYYFKFAWQSGYAAFSVSQSVLDTTVEYIKNQEAHHKKMSFEEEFVKFLNLNRIKYDTTYLFSFE